MMDTSASKFKLRSFLLYLLVVCSSGSILHTSHYNNFLLKPRPSIRTTQHLTGVVEPPITTLPTAPTFTTPVTNPVTTPVTNPVTTPATGSPTTTVPPIIPTPPLVTIPSATPSTPPLTFPPPAPVSNPVTTPSTTIPGGPQPIPNPVNTYPGPATGTGGTGGGGGSGTAVPGQSWCVARAGAPETAVQAALDYACGTGSADCSAIQQGGSCYSPNSLQNHASFAFNSYYQRNPVQTSCDFGGAAMVTNANPSSGSCIYPTGSTSSSASPTTTNPVTSTPIPTPTTTIPVTTPIPMPTTEPSSGATPTSSIIPPAFGGGVGGYGESPMAANISSGSSFQPLLGSVVALTTIIITGVVLDDGWLSKSSFYLHEN